MDADIPRAGDLSIPQAFLLLATNDTDGEPDVVPAVLRAGLAGATLAELELLGAIELQGKYVVTTRATPRTDFQHQLEILRDRPGLHTPKKCVSMLESRAELHRVYEGMAALGIVEHVGERHLGLFRTTRYPEKDHTPEAALLQQIEALLGGAPAGDAPGGGAPAGGAAPDAAAPGAGVFDPRATALVGLLYATDLFGRLFPHADQSRAREMARNYWPSRAVADELRMVRLADAEAAT